MKSKIFHLAIFSFLMATLSPLASAAQYDIKEMTPAIQQALSSRQERYEQIQNLKSKGVLGEDNQGFIKALQNTVGPNALAAAENADRNILYSAIVEQNNLGAQGMAEVRRIFAEVQRDKARPGDYVQLPSGEWTKK